MKRTLYAELRAAGLCITCRGTARPGRCMCAPCAESNRRRMNERNAERILADVCVLCAETGERLTPGGLCAECAEYKRALNRAYQRKRRPPAARPCRCRNCGQLGHFAKACENTQVDAASG